MDSIWLIPPGPFNLQVTLEAEGRIMEVEKGRTLLYISRKIVGDSAWPFAAGEKVHLTLDPRGKRLVVERMPASRKA